MEHRARDEREAYVPAIRKLDPHGYQDNTVILLDVLPSIDLRTAKSSCKQRLVLQRVFGLATYHASSKLQITDAGALILSDCPRVAMGAKRSQGLAFAGSRRTSVAKSTSNHLRPCASLLCPFLLKCR